MTSKKRLGSSLADQLRVYQTFAEQHYWQRRRSPGLILPTHTPVCDNPAPNPPRTLAIHCPMCLLKHPIKQMTVEHGPQRGGQSRLGPATVAVLTCQRCNNGSGERFERGAAELLQGDPDELTVAELAELERHRAQIEQLLELSMIATPLPFLLTDVKAAFTIAFSTLGYRFALAPTLRPVRVALAEGRDPGPQYAAVFTINDASFTGPGVLEIRDPVPSVFVAASTGYGVLLPMPGGPLLPPVTQLDRLTARRYPWPETAHHAKVNEVERAYRLGTLFHADLCHPHQLPSDIPPLAPASAAGRLPVALRV